MNLTSKSKRMILAGSSISVTALMIYGLWYVYAYHEDSWWWLGGLFVLEVVCLALMAVIPRWLDTPVVNQLAHSLANERLVLNGREQIWKVVGRMVLAYVVEIMIYGLCVYLVSLSRPQFMIMVFAVGILVMMSPMYADSIYRTCKNTYTIEGSNLIIDEWAWFRPKTDHLVIPIAEISHISRPNMSQVQIEVAGVKRPLASGIVSEELYNALKERMQ